MEGAHRDWRKTGVWRAFGWLWWGAGMGYASGDTSTYKRVVSGKTAVCTRKEGESVRRPVRVRRCRRAFSSTCTHRSAVCTQGTRPLAGGEPCAVLLVGGEWRGERGYSGADAVGGGAGGVGVSWGFGSAVWAECNGSKHTCFFFFGNSGRLRCLRFLRDFRGFAAEDLTSLRSLSTAGPRVAVACCRAAVQHRIGLVNVDQGDCGSQHHENSDGGLGGEHVGKL